MDSSRRALLALLLMLAAMWFWKARSEEAAESPLAYSQLFAWAQQGKIESVVHLRRRRRRVPQEGRELGRQTDSDVSLRPSAERSGLAADAQGEGCEDRRQESEAAVRRPARTDVASLGTLFIMGAWVWMSRRARGMLGAGGPLRRTHEGPWPQIRQGDVGQRDVR